MTNTHFLYLHLSIATWTIDFDQLNKVMRFEFLAVSPTGTGQDLDFDQLNKVMSFEFLAVSPTGTGQDLDFDQLNDFSSDDAPSRATNPQNGSPRCEGFAGKK